MKTPYTPGPWTSNQWGESIGIDSKDFMNLAVINPNGDHSKGIPSRFDAANARVIAAAPDLLEALQQIRGVHSESEWMQLAPLAYQQALDALARAVGE